MEEAGREQQQRDRKLTTTEANSSHEEGELSPKNDEQMNNGHAVDSKSRISPNRHPYADDSNKSRFLPLYFSALICLFIWGNGVLELM